MITGEMFVAGVLILFAIGLLNLFLTLVGLTRIGDRLNEIEERLKK